MKEEKPYACFYDQGFTGGLAGIPIDQCPYWPVGENRLELLSRRAAWLEGHSDGKSRLLQCVATGEHIPGKRKRPSVAKADPGRLVPATVQRRYQRRKMLADGQSERYVDRRLRQITAEREHPVTLPPKGS